MGLKAASARRASVVAACLILVSACGDDDVGGSNSDSLPTVTEPAGDAENQGSTTLPANAHVVERGDTLWGIAQDECGDPRAYVELFNQNQGLIQDDGAALVEPGLIEVGWILIVSCPEIEFVPAPSGDEIVDPDTPITSEGGDDGGALPTNELTEPVIVALRDLPSTDIDVAPAAEAAGSRPDSVEISTSCLGTSTLPLVSSPFMVLRSGETSDAYDVRYGQFFAVQVENMTDVDSVRLVDKTGAIWPIERRQADVYDLYVDPRLPSGTYVVEARSSTGEEPAFGRISIAPPDEPTLIRRDSTDPTAYVLLGGQGVVDTHVYQHRTDGCVRTWEYWQDGGTVASSEDGNGLINLVTGQAPDGSYCLVFDGPRDLLSQCNRGSQRFRVP